MKFDLTKSIQILERTPKLLRLWLTDLSEDWTMNNEGAETWSVYDIVGHLVHGEKTDWITRLEIILGNGDKHFKKFDRFAQFTESKGKTLNDLVYEFETLRRHSIQVLRSKDINEELLKRTGIHPHFGEVTLEQLLSTWTTHDLAHTAQIARVMAKQYKESVGPWIEYMRILQS